MDYNRFPRMEDWGPAYRSQQIDLEMRDWSWAEFAHRVCLNDIFTPLSRPVPTEDLRPVRREVRKLRTEWITRLEEIGTTIGQQALSYRKKKDGTPTRQSMGAFRRAMECPVVLFYHGDPQLPCNRPIFCPHCWCRQYTTQLYRRLHRTIGSVKGAIYCHLQGNMAKYWVRQSNGSGPSIYAILSQAFAREHWRHRGIHGGAMCVTAAPTDGKSLVLICRSLALGTAEALDRWKPPIELDGGGRSLLAGRRTQRRLNLTRRSKRDGRVWSEQDSARLAGQITRWPRGLLYGNIESIREIYTDRPHRFSNLRCYGVLTPKSIQSRQPKEEDDGEAEG